MLKRLIRILFWKMMKSRIVKLSSVQIRVLLFPLLMTYLYSGVFLQETRNPGKPFGFLTIIMFFSILRLLNNILCLNFRSNLRNMSDSFLVNTSKDHYNRHMQIGFIGLGKMGSRMAVKLLQENHDLVVWNRSPEGISNFQFLISNAKSNSNYKITKTIQELVEGLKTPRIVWIMVTAGRSGSEDATQNVLDEVVQYLEQGDIVIDGGNAFYKDSEQRSE